MTFKEYMNEVNGIMLHTDRSIYTGKQLEEIAEDYYKYKLDSDGVSADVSLAHRDDESFLFRVFYEGNNAAFLPEEDYDLVKEKFREWYRKEMSED